MLWRCISFLLVIQFAQYASAAVLGSVYVLLRLFWKKQLREWKYVIRDRKGLFLVLFLVCELWLCILQLILLWFWCRFFVLSYISFFFLTILLQLGEAIWKYRSVMAWTKEEEETASLIYRS